MVFAEANLSFKAIQADLKRKGFGDTTHYQPIDENDIARLYSSGVFDESTPSGLQNKIWFEIMLFICRRGRENLRELEKDHFQISQDSNGRRFVFQAKDEMTKKVRADNMKTRVDNGRMYETKNPGCPVASFERYLNKLNPSCSSLFQTPMPRVPSDDNKPWYKNCPMGSRQIGTFMARISETAGLSRRYTNHSIRSTCITVLDEQGFDSRDICNVSGHQNESSIRTYIGRPNDSKKQKLSDALSSAIGQPPVDLNTPHNDSPATESVAPPDAPSSGSQPDPPSESEAQPETSSLTLSPILSNSQIEEVLEVCNYEQRNQEMSTTSATTSTLHSRSVRRQNISHLPAEHPMTMHGCNVTINHYYAMPKQ